MFGIRDSKVRERLLRETKLSLEKADEICRASESMLAQMKVVGNSEGQTVNAVNRATRRKAQKLIDRKGKLVAVNTQTLRNAGTAAPITITQRKNYAQHFSRLVSNAESCHILRLNVAAREKIPKITTTANLSELSTTLIAIRKCSMPQISQGLNWMTLSWLRLNCHPETISVFSQTRERSAT